MAEERLPHGYTNATARQGETVVKRYVGPDAGVRQRREAIALERLADLMAVPPLLGTAPDGLVLGWVDGVPGQEALEARPEAVLHAVGALARNVAEIDVGAVLGPAPAGWVLVHGDFGPQNVLVRDDLVTALLDWEWVHVGRPYEDVAWAEWIVRNHHPHLVGALPALFDGFGFRPPWAVRHAAMLDRCAELTDFVERWAEQSGDRVGVDTWRDRTAATIGFRSRV